MKRRARLQIKPNVGIKLKNILSSENYQIQKEVNVSKNENLNNKTHENLGNDNQSESDKNTRVETFVESKVDAPTSLHHTPESKFDNKKRRARIMVRPNVSLKPVFSPKPQPLESPLLNVDSENNNNNNDHSRNNKKAETMNDNTTVYNKKSITSTDDNDNLNDRSKNNNNTITSNFVIPNTNNIKSKSTTKIIKNTNDENKNKIMETNIIDNSKNILDSINLHEIIAFDNPVNEDACSGNDDVTKLTQSIGIITKNNNNGKNNTVMESSNLSYGDGSYINDNESTIDNKVNKSLSSQQLDERLINKKNKERQKCRQTQTLEEPVDASVVCMKDLIYCNPLNNPMKYRANDIKGRKKRKLTDDVSETISVTSVKSNKKNIQNNEATKNSNNNGGDEDVGVPQIEIGADGKIVINEKSLEVGVESDGEMEVVNETGVNKSGYPKKIKTRTWGINETKKFYAALSMIGTDFTLMTQVFPWRSRMDLKRKFKREDKLNRFLVDAALKERRPLDITLLAEPIYDDVYDKKMTNKKKLSNEGSADDNVECEDETSDSDEKKKGKNKKNKKKFTIYDDSSSNDDVKKVDDEVSSVVTSQYGGGDDDDDDDIQVTSIIRRQRTKSGRLVKPPMAFDLVTSAITESQPVKKVSKKDQKLHQQLQQMKQDKREQTIKGVLSCLKDDDQVSVIESVADDDANKEHHNSINKVIASDEAKKNDESKASKRLKGMQVLDHTKVDLASLGIEHIPSHHRLVVLPQYNNSDNDDEDVQMHVFVVAEDTLQTVLNADFNTDPTQLFFSLINSNNPS